MLRMLGWELPALHLHNRTWHGRWPLWLSEEHPSCTLEPGQPGEILELQQAPGTTCPARTWHPPSQLLTGTTPVSLFSAGHTDDFQCSQGAGAALKAEGEGQEAGLRAREEGGLLAWVLAWLMPCELAVALLQGHHQVPVCWHCWGAMLRAGFALGRTTW